MIIYSPEYNHFLKINARNKCTTNQCGNNLAIYSNIFMVTTILSTLDKYITSTGQNTTLNNTNTTHKLHSLKYLVMEEF